MFQPHSRWLRALVGLAVAVTTGVSLVVAAPAATASPVSTAAPDVTSPALVSPVGSAAGVTPRGPVAPPGARAWLGQWRTNFGLVTFDDVYLAKSDAPDVHGNPQYYWRLVGTWAGHGRISGGVLQAGFQTFGGCWKPADKAVSCGKILMYRSGNRITGGYWKECRNYCTSHHPWSGSKVAPRWTLGFRFTQRGLPDGHRVIRTQTGGAGSIALATPSDTSGNPVDGSRMFHVDEVIGAPMKMTVRLAGGSWDRVGRRMFLDLTGVVDSSEDSRIKRGSFVRVRLLDGRGLGPDRITIWFTTGFVDLPHSEEWTSTDPQRVNVAIGEPTRTV
ncbi:MAG: hypothetical protein QG671_179 [Actinomycetota bacterium]|nr:hypothetical protein [Actinomycetota bacterium]